MGWKGTVRSMGATYRSIQREEQRRQKELQRQHKEMEKMEALQRAAYEVDVYENHIQVIQSIHKERGKQIDWSSISRSPKPSEPKRKNTNERKFQCGFFKKILGNEANEKAKAIEKDTQIYEKECEKWKSDCAEWRDNRQLAEKLLAGDQGVKLEIIKQMRPFDDISELGTSIRFEISGGLVEATLSPHGQDVVPTERKTLLQSGKLSAKKMPKGVFNEIHQDYICSCVLRIGNELLALLPDKIVLVHVMDTLLNTKTGHMEEQCIASVAISRDTIAALNMDMIDPSDSFSNFVHNMKFKKTKGFEPVEKLSPERFIGQAEG